MPFAEAMREVLDLSVGADLALSRRLDAAAALRDGSTEMAIALRGVWRALSREQKNRVVADSDEEADP